MTTRWPPSSSNTSTSLAGSSIGVVVSKPNVAGFLAKLGINTESLARGELAEPRHDRFPREDDRHHPPGHVVLADRREERVVAREEVHRDERADQQQLVGERVQHLPEVGVLGEIAVPFSDTRRASSVFADRGYRVYYSTTHWITDTIVNRDEKSIWYKIFDRLTQESYFVPSHEMRVISPNEFSSLSSEVPEEKKRIYVDLATQTVTAFESENPVLVTRCASGAKGTETPLGEFRIRDPASI